MRPKGTCTVMLTSQCSIGFYRVDDDLLDALSSGVPIRLAVGSCGVWGAAGLTRRELWQTVTPNIYLSGFAAVLEREEASASSELGVDMARSAQTLAAAVTSAAARS